MKTISLNDSDFVIGSRVRECRIKWNLTQQELANELTITFFLRMKILIKNRKATHSAYQKQRLSDTFICSSQYFSTIRINSSATAT